MSRLKMGKQSHVDLISYSHSSRTSSPGLGGNVMSKCSTKWNHLIFRASASNDIFFLTDWQHHLDNVILERGRIPLCSDLNSIRDCTRCTVCLLMLFCVLYKLHPCQHSKESDILRLFLLVFLSAICIVSFLNEQHFKNYTSLETMRKHKQEASFTCFGFGSRCLHSVLHLHQHCTPYIPWTLAVLCDLSKRR